MATSAIIRRQAADDRLLVTGAIAGLAVGAALLHFLVPINHDEAYFIALVGRLLDGGEIGKDVMDINMPHVWWISAVPVWFARQLGLRPDIAATAFTVAMAILSLAGVAHLIAAAGFTRFARNLFLVFAALLVLFVPGYDFGQREHWMVLLTLPYIVACGCRPNKLVLPAAVGAAVGVAACPGFCIKPYFLLVPVALEIWILVRLRRPSLAIRSETIAMVTAGIVCAGLTVTYAWSYLEVDMPTALLAYWSYNSSLQEVFLSAAILLAPASMLVAVAYLARQKDVQTSALAQALAVAGAASLVAALIQAKPWSYHFLPAIIFFNLSAVALLAAEKPRADKLTLRRIAFAILVAMAIAPTAFEAKRIFEGTSSSGKPVGGGVPQQSGAEQNGVRIHALTARGFPGSDCRRRRMGNPLLLRVSHRRRRARRRSASRRSAENKGCRIKSGRDGDFRRAHQRARGHRYCDRQ